MIVHYIERDDERSWVHLRSYMGERSVESFISYASLCWNDRAVADALDLAKDKHVELLQVASAAQTLPH